MWIGRTSYVRSLEDEEALMGEGQRLAFIEASDGLSAAVEFAQRTLRIYRRAVLTSRKRGHVKPHHASIPQYRREFIESYCAFKRYLSDKGELSGI